MRGGTSGRRRGCRPGAAGSRSARAGWARPACPARVPGPRARPACPARRGERATEVGTPWTWAARGAPAPPTPGPRRRCARSPAPPVTGSAVTGWPGAPAYPYPGPCPCPCRCLRVPPALAGPGCEGPGAPAHPRPRLGAVDAGHGAGERKTEAGRPRTCAAHRAPVRPGPRRRSMCSPAAPVTGPRPRRNRRGTGPGAGAPGPYPLLRPRPGPAAAGRFPVPRVRKCTGSGPTRRRRRKGHPGGL